MRTAHSNFIEAKEVLESQKQVVEEAEEALRLASARNDAGTGTQLDVLQAASDLTRTRTTRLSATYLHNAALARLDRACGGKSPSLGGETPVNDGAAQALSLTRPPSSLGKTK